MFRRTIRVNFARDGFPTFSTDATFAVSAVGVGRASVLASVAESVETNLSVEAVRLRRARGRREAPVAPAAEPLLALAVVSDEIFKVKALLNFFL